MNNKGEFGLFVKRDDLGRFMPKSPELFATVKQEDSDDDLY